MDNDARLEINLKPKNVFQISINLQDQSGFPVPQGQIKISNVPMTEEMDDEQYNIANEYHNAWRYILTETTKLPGNFSFLAEYGTYYIQIKAKEFCTEFQTLKVKKGSSAFNFQLTPKIMTKINFIAIDMISTKPLKNTSLMIYDRGGHFIKQANTNNIGQCELKLELGSTFKVYTKRDGYIDLYQEFIATTSAILEMMVLRLIPRAKENEPKFEIFAVYQESLFDVTL